MLPHFLPVTSHQLFAKNTSIFAPSPSLFLNRVMFGEGVRCSRLPVLVHGILPVLRGQFRVQVNRGTTTEQSHARRSTRSASR